MSPPPADESTDNAIPPVDLAETLRRSEARFRLAAASTNEILYEWTLATGAIEWFGDIAALLGCDPSDVPTNIASFLAYIHAEDRERVTTTARAGLQAGDRWQGEYRVVRKNGTIATWYGTGIGRYDASGQAAGVLGAVADVSERKRSEQALRESEARYRLITENMQDTISVFDLDLRCTYVSPSIKRLRGYSPEEVLEQSLADTLTVESLARVRSAFAEEMQREATGGADPQRTRILELQERRRDGSTIWVENTVSFLRDASGRATEILILARDISERKRAEAERQRLHGQLAMAQKMESVGRLAGGVAHDFNNMLTVILTNTDLVLGALDPSSPCVEDLQAIRGAAKHSAELTGQLLAFARKQTVTPQILDLNETVSGALKMLRRLIDENIELIWSPGPAVGQIRVDPSQIEQVLTNLCVNARDSIDGVGQIIIETASARPAGLGAGPGDEERDDYVSLSVTDTGRGMDDATMARIFEPFFTTKELGRGTGLGLATVHGIVEQNGGRITVTSAPGAGAAFTIFLPRCARVSAGAVATPAPPAAPQGGETVLLVEDEKAILRVARRLLEQLGYTVVAAAGPGEAMQLAREHRGEIHLLLTDVVMPEMNGRELARNLLALFPRVRCLFMSGYTADVIAHHGVLEEGVQFLEKPFTADELAARVRAALER